MGDLRDPGGRSGGVAAGAGAAEQLLAGYAEALITAADAAIGPWVERSVARRWVDYTGAEPAPALRAASAEAGREAAIVVVARLRELLQADVDAQRTGPLAVLRRAVAYPTAVLRAAGVPPLVRDDFAERNFPDDDYDLSPASFADIDESLHEPGLVWGAAKAHVVLTRRRGRP